MLFKLSNLNSNLALTQGYLNPALNNSALLPFVSWLRRQQATVLAYKSCQRRRGERVRKLRSDKQPSRKRYL